ncbi:MAG: NAD(P)H-dependent oxidoreductase subunit E [Candidatus Latescibacteria bacterium]|nr:NAD(P)H-dependent oxidoreductase subunit E [Candidatus Latescibacterota bacterium]
MLIDQLKAIQHRHGYLPAEELHALAERTNTPLYEIHGVASFYPHFRLEPPPPVDIRVCADVSCHLRGAYDVLATVRETVERAGLDGWVVGETSCLGQCDGAPAVAINGRSYGRVTLDSLARQVETLAEGRPLRRQGLRRPQSTGEIDPYDGESRYEGLTQFVQSGDPESVIAALKESGLRGMGGAGFPAGMKWDLVRKTPADIKYVICNADESEPGTCKDRELLRTAPHLVVEGIILGALVSGATKGYIFLRHEYDREREIVGRTIKQCYRDRLLGDRLLGTDHTFHLEIFDSPGGYICGEETALLEALEGKRAEPRNKPPFPGTHGLYGKPTLINNVETFAWVPSILRRGAAWFKGRGVNGASGLKYIALSGHVRRPGVYEIPLGTTVADLIASYGGGMLDGLTLKAFAPGGASSGFLPASMADIPLDFGALAKAGSMLGSGAVVAVADGTCMLDLAKNVATFFRNESCGKCVPCRTGSQQLVTLLDRVSRGEGTPDLLDPVADLAETMALTSICGLGQAAPLPVTSVLKYFPDEVYDHITKRRCPSGVCFRE